MLLNFNVTVSVGFLLGKLALEADNRWLGQVCQQSAHNSHNTAVFSLADVIRRKVLHTTTWVICRTILQIAINTKMCYMHPTHNHLGYKQNSNLTNPNLCKSLHSLIRSIKLITHTNRHFTSKTI